MINLMTDGNFLRWPNTSDERPPTGLLMMGGFSMWSPASINSLVVNSSSNRTGTNGLHPSTSNSINTMLRVCLGTLYMLKMMRPCSELSGHTPLKLSMAATRPVARVTEFFYSISAAENLLIFGADVSNAFAEAPPPKQGFYIIPDRAFFNWWINRKKRPPIPHGHVIPILSAMQRHPELP